MPNMQIVQLRQEHAACGKALLLTVINKGNSVEL
jgi:hypothetical protein